MSSLRDDTRRTIKNIRCSQKLFIWTIQSKSFTASHDEINLKIDDMELELYKGSRGRKVVLIKICNNYYPKQDEPKDDTTEVLIFDYLKPED